MFDINAGEAVILAFVAVLVMGPEKLPIYTKQLGRMLRTLRGMANNARDELRSELGSEYSDLQLRDLDPRNLVRKQIIDAMNDDEDDVAIEQPTKSNKPPPFDPEAT